MNAPTFTWPFPLPTCHHGLLLGNGRMGVMVWGEGRVLRMTVGRADFWDHRGGMPWTADMSFTRIRTLLEANDEKGLRDIFENRGPGGERAMRPTIVPVGRVEIELPAEVTGAELDPSSGHAVFRLANGHKFYVVIAPRDPVLLLSTSTGPLPTRAIPAADINRAAVAPGKDAWTERSLPQPESFTRDDATGFVQPLPVDPALALAFRWDAHSLYIVTERGPDAPAATHDAAMLLASAVKEGELRFGVEAGDWWKQFWAAAPKVSIPNPTLQFLYTYGLYKLGASTNPRGVACGLQGPWIEDDRLPAWSADYHFNINVQMCYGPAYSAGLGTHLRPLWKMLRTWEPQLRTIARMFAGIDDGIMMPHAVDDRGTNMGGFWTGTIDHGCTAWVAKMMFDAWDYGLEDDAFLATTAYPWLVGALNVYRAMAEKRPDGSWAFPVTVSPEYRGSAANAWGQNASFQLAAAHCLLDCLDIASQALARDYPPEWAEFRATLPHACLESPPGKDAPQIMLWQGVPLEESHRHHSHLAAITPFCTIDPLSSEWRDITDRSLETWIAQGMGRWSGWCLSWASQIHTRVGNASSAEFILETFVRYFTNHGNGTVHNCLHRGMTLMGATALTDWNWQAMQLDGGQGSCSAVIDMLAHDRRGVVALFAGCPDSWTDASFENISLPGGFKVSAQMTGGRLKRLSVLSHRGGTFRYTMRGSPATISLPTIAGTTTQLI